MLPLIIVCDDNLSLLLPLWLCGGMTATYVLYGACAIYLSLIPLFCTLLCSLVDAGWVRSPCVTIDDWSSTLVSHVTSDSLARMTSDAAPISYISSLYPATPGWSIAVNRRLPFDLHGTPRNPSILFVL